MKYVNHNGLDNSRYNKNTETYNEIKTIITTTKKK